MKPQDSSSVYLPQIPGSHFLLETSVRGALIVGNFTGFTPKPWSLLSESKGEATGESSENQGGDLGMNLGTFHGSNMSAASQLIELGDHEVG